MTEYNNNVEDSRRVIIASGGLWDGILDEKAVDIVSDMWEIIGLESCGDLSRRKTGHTIQLHGRTLIQITDRRTREQVLIQ